VNYNPEFLLGKRATAHTFSHVNSSTMYKDCLALTCLIFYFSRGLYYTIYRLKNIIGLFCKLSSILST